MNIRFFLISSVSTLLSQQLAEVVAEREAERKSASTRTRNMSLISTDRRSDPPPAAGPLPGASSGLLAITAGDAGVDGGAYGSVAGGGDPAEARAAAKRVTELELECARLNGADRPVRPARCIECNVRLLAVCPRLTGDREESQRGR